jgi:UDP-glucose 4-epimerase
MAVAPLSPYGVAKYAGEAYCKSFYEAYGLETVALRYFNVFGPRQSPFSEYAAVIPAFIASAIVGDAATIYGDGLQSRDFTYVKNIVDANVCAVGNPAAPGETFNVACGASHTLLDVLDAVRLIARREASVVFEPARVGEVRASQADMSKAHAILGYEPRVGLTEGLAWTFGQLADDEMLIPRINERRRWLAVAAT